jgi:CRISPR-associated endonuclease/helicase Cas3
MRGIEREYLLHDPILTRFMPESSRTENRVPGTVYLVCTSAGEVGINISADHLICDLSTFDSMAQRFGRVNRFGLRNDTRIDIVHPAKFDAKDKLTAARRNTFALLAGLDDASPAVLAKLDPGVRSGAFAPEPVTLPTSDILFDAWSMTSLRRPMPARPKVEPYLHGIRDWEPPQTKIAWRAEVAEITGERLSEYSPRDLLDLYPLKSHELLSDRTDRVFVTLSDMTPADDQPIWIVDEEGNVAVTSWKRVTEGRKEAIQGAILLLPPQLGGLERGLFTASAKYDPTVPYDVADEWRVENRPMRVRLRSIDDGLEPKTPAGMKSVARIVFTNPADEDHEPIKIWRWYVRLSVAEADAQSKRSYPLKTHLNDAKQAAADVVSGLLLERELGAAVVYAIPAADRGFDSHPGDQQRRSEAVRLHQRGRRRQSYRRWPKTLHCNIRAAAQPRSHAP